jgi:hypothetical protein
MLCDDVCFYVAIEIPRPCTSVNRLELAFQSVAVGVRLRVFTIPLSIESLDEDTCFRPSTYQMYQRHSRRLPAFFLLRHRRNRPE